MANSKGRCQIIATVVVVTYDFDLVVPSVKVTVANQPFDPPYHPLHLLNHPYLVQSNQITADSAFATVGSAVVIAASSFVIVVIITSSSAFTSSFIATVPSSILIASSSFILVSQTQIPCWQLPIYH